MKLAAQAFGDCRCLHRIAYPEQHDEFPAADTSDDVFVAQHRLRAGDEMLQAGVSCIMAMFVGRIQPR